MMREFAHDAAHPAVIAALLHDHRLQPKKSAGQNFFSDAGLLEKMANAAGITPEDAVLEIGPGLGALTQRLSVRARRVVCVELDGDLLSPLETTLAEADNVTIVHRDFLKMKDEELCALLDGETSVRMVSNLPYCITTDAMQKLFLSRLPLVGITALVQKEAAQRITAQPGQKQYGVTAMMCRYYCDARILYDVPPEAFFPRPGVTSAVIRCDFRPPRPEPACGEAFLWRVARAAIAMRRKTIRNNLCAAGFETGVVLSCLEQCEIEPSVRAETLDIFQIERLAETIFAQTETKLAK